MPEMNGVKQVLYWGRRRIEHHRTKLRGPGDSAPEIYVSLG